MILLGFAVLMTGMSEMSGAVSGLRDVPEFANFLLLFSNPLFGVLAGALLTAVIQSSSASVGILQALSSTGAVTYAISIPIIMGQNIGTCVTALLASVDATKSAKRAAMVHLYLTSSAPLCCLPCSMVRMQFFILTLWAKRRMKWESPLCIQPSTCFAPSCSCRSAACWKTCLPYGKIRAC